MPEGTEWAPPGIDTASPSIARMYDYYLGGKDNYAVDRAAADKLLAVAPEIAEISRRNRAFLGRAVRFLAEQGIRQFVDIGTGLPTQNNVHQVARTHAPDARVAYVDNDPIVLAHARALLADNAETIVAEADLLDPDSVLANPVIRRHIDFDRPVAILLIAILHFFADDDRPYEIVARLRDAIPAGSYLALSHVVSEDHPEAIDAAQDVYRSFLKRSGDARRTRADVLEFFDGFELVDPGLVYVSRWRPDETDDVPEADDAWIVGGVARKI
ncbi:SAM-dependent methyltransferase [Actinomadura sp. HBU206391]|uniref:SAM-dependent methyltransferase n=1 Tax=Actinomadura sp. HBU206391 TaxID=2731692 RepID=UPI0016500F28|nr:SAM-dependent methyltransferase [Actinomadura sp. HBU206391]MBC6460805.1 SAM-dependent methyltransferase [Actinomadura sp. HBU206391]